MNFTFNIELRPDQIEHDKQFVMDVFASQMINAVCSLRHFEYLGLNGPTKTNTLVVRAGLAAKYTAIGLAFHFAEMLGQDYVAVKRNDATCGMLVGPNAEKWGPFDIAFFREFS